MTTFKLTHVIKFCLRQIGLAFDGVHAGLQFVAAQIFVVGIPVLASLAERREVLEVRAIRVHLRILGTRRLRPCMG